MKTKLLSLFLFLFALFALSINAKQAHAAVPIPKGVGVCTHSTDARELDMIKEAGFTIARTDFKWAEVERTKGQYNWSTADNIVNSLTSRGIRPYLILDYNNFAYGVSNELDGIKNQEQITGYTNFAKAAVARYKGKGIIWEIWNEPNLDMYWAPANNATAYMNLLKSAVPAMKAADPSAIVVAPAVAFVANTFSFLEACGQQGLYGMVDAISVHPYQNANPENGGLDYLYDTIRNQIKKYNPNNPNLPIIGGEFGFSNSWSNVKDDTTQARYLVRQLAYHDLKNIPISMVYNMKNKGTNASDAEHNFGIIRADYSKKPAFNAIQNFNKNMSGMTFGGRMPSNNAEHMYEYVNAAGEKMTIAWTTGASRSLTIYGQSVTLTADPVYVRNVPVVNVPSVPSAPTELKVVNVSKGASSGNYFVNLSWKDNSNNETGFQVQQSINSENNYQPVATPAANATTTSINIGSTPTQGTYFYKIVALNTAGASAASNTASTNIVIALAPTNLTAQLGVIQSSGTYNAVLKWLDNSDNEIGYDIYQSVGNQNDFHLVSSICPFSGTGEVSSLYNIGINPPFNTYSYKVVAKFADGSTKESNIVSVEVKDFVSASPSELKAVGTKDIAGKPYVVLTWKDNSANEQGFNIYFAASQTGTFTKIGSAGKDATMVVHSPNAAGTYYYKITSFNASGESTATSVIPVIVN